MSKNSIIKGTLILTIAGVATKLLGFYNRIFLTRLIGVRELGIYQLIFPIYLLAFAISAQGITTALTKEVSYFDGRNEPKKTRLTLRFGILISVSFAVLVMSFIHLFSESISKFILKNTDCSILVRIIVIAVPFIALKACLNSFFIGINKPVYQGITNFFEQICRILAAYILAKYITSDSKLAVIAVISGEILATVMSISFYAHHCEKNPTVFKASLPPKKAPVKKSVLRLLLTDAVPITINSVMLTLFSSLEAFLMPSMLYLYYKSSDTALEMFGIVSGIVVPFLLFPATITTALSTMLLPAVSYASAKNDKDTISKAKRNSILFCTALGICAWLFYYIFGGLICRIAFSNETAGILLRRMSFVCPLIYISGNLSAILNGTGKAFKNLIYHIISIVIRILFIVFLVPNFSINAYILGMTLSYIVLDVLMIME